MKVALCLVACMAVVALAQIRPHISETFEGEGYSHIVTVNGSYWGLGHWVIDEPVGKAIELWEYTGEHRHLSIHLLKRYDLGAEYSIFFHHYPTPHRTCHKFPVKPPMPPAWAWLRESHYAGKHVRDGTTFDWWRHHFHGTELEVAVSEHDASRPHYFIRRSAEEQRMYHLISFSHFKPNETWFHVPDICKNATEVESLNAAFLAAIQEEAAHPATMGSDEAIRPACAIAASNAARIVEESNGYNAAAMVSAAFEGATISTPRDLWGLQAGGSRCAEGVRVGDVFFDGLPATSAAVYLGDDKFAECSALLGTKKCEIVPQRDFTGGCRRYC